MCIHYIYIYTYCSHMFVISISRLIPWSFCPRLTEIFLHYCVFHDHFGIFFYHGIYVRIILNLVSSWTSGKNYDLTLLIISFVNTNKQTPFIIIIISFYFFLAFITHKLLVKPSIRPSSASTRKQNPLFASIFLKDFLQIL